jgi:multiple sugar transport system substrate-binding protein
VFLILLFLIAGCAGPPEDEGVTIVFKHGKIAGDTEAFRDLLDRFEKENPGIRVTDETLPASTDEQHQFYVINLAGDSSDFDVLSMDVIWVQEFAKAGWLKPLDRIFPFEEREEFFKGPVDAVTYTGSAYAVPWYIDAGVLYYRKDLLSKYGFSPPRTWDELVKIAKHITGAEPPGLYGFIWQGKQYEGLVCNVLEYMWSNGGELFRDGNPGALTEENVSALEFMKDLIYKHRVTPELVRTAIEEDTRHTFGNGRAVFMRNWPYAWNIFEREGSPVKGKVGVAPLPSFEGGESSPTLGGWQLGINRFSKHQREAEKLIKFLTSDEVQKQLALTVGYKPTRKETPEDALRSIDSQLTRILAVEE